MIFALPFFLEKNVNTLLILGCSFKNTVFGLETVKLKNVGFSIDLGDVNSGLYLFELSSKNTQWFKKILVR